MKSSKGADGSLTLVFARYILAAVNWLMARRSYVDCTMYWRPSVPKRPIYLSRRVFTALT